MRGTLILLANLLDDSASHEEWLPASAGRTAASLQGLIAESEKGGRLYLRRLIGAGFRDVPIQLLNEHTQDAQLPPLLEPLLRGERWGLVSDCGLPVLADPGAKLVHLARQHQIAVTAQAGPCAITMALMLSGLSAQSFVFHGYPPRQREAMTPFFSSLDLRVVQVCIEAPYRSQGFFDHCLHHLPDRAMLCIASSLTSGEERVATLRVSEWRRMRPTLGKCPTVFLFHAS